MAEHRTRRGGIRPMLVIAVTLLASLAVLASAAPAGLAGASLAVIALAGYRDLARSPAHVVRLESAAGSSLDGVRGTLRADAANGLFVALRVASADGRTRRALIFADQLDRDAFRRLLAFVRHG